MKTTAKKRILEIPRRFVDKRFDMAALALIREKYPESTISRGDLSRRIRAGQVTLDGAVVSPDHLVKLHDTFEVLEDILSVSVPYLESRQNIQIPVLYEDDFLVVFNKPAGVQMHPAGSRERDTVAHFITTAYPELAGIGDNPLRPGIVHRLDRETSGVLLVAKTQTVFDELKKLFQERSIEKTYITLVYGHTPELDGSIDRPILQRSGELKRFVVETRDVPEAARQALTLYQVIARYKDFDLLSVTPKTGRTHQIRVHLASLGNPVVGDKLYAWKPMRRGETLFSERQLLHAFRLQFELFSKKYAFEAPLPEDFRKVLSDIDETREAGYDGEALENLVAR